MKTPTVIGHTGCPICDNQHAEVRLDKNGLAYIYCNSGCYTQVFTRDKHRDSLLREKMRPVTEAPASPAPADPPGTVPTVPPAPTPAPTSAPAQKPTRSWLTPLLDRKPA